MHKNQRGLFQSKGEAGAEDLPLVLTIYKHVEIFQETVAGSLELELAGIFFSS